MFIHSSTKYKQRNNALSRRMCALHYVEFVRHGDFVCGAQLRAGAPLHVLRSETPDPRRMSTESTSSYSSVSSSDSLATIHERVVAYNVPWGSAGAYLATQVGFPHGVFRHEWGGCEHKERARVCFADQPSSPFHTHDVLRIWTADLQAARPRPTSDTLVRLKIPFAKTAECITQWVSRVLFKLDVQGFRIGDVECARSGYLVLQEPMDNLRTPHSFQRTHSLRGVLAGAAKLARKLSFFL
jgi:hypothetical protein